MLEKNFLKDPKIDLHCHLDGSMTLNSISEILGKDVFFAYGLPSVFHLFCKSQKVFQFQYCAII